MKEYKTIERPVQRYSVIDAITCDRCGKPALCSGGCADEREDRPEGAKWSSFSGPWGFSRGMIQGGGSFDADLCHDCTDDLLSWLRDGKGAGPTVRGD